MNRKATHSIFLFLCVALISNCTTGAPQPAEIRPAPMVSAPPSKEAENLMKQAEDLEKSGRAGSAIPLWERVAQNYPNSPAAAKSFYRLGKIYFDQSQPEKALQYFEYLLYAYPNWEGANLARLERLRALSLTGKKKQVMKEAMPLWDASAGNPAVQVGLCQLMADLYLQEGEPDTAFEWVSAGFNAARDPEEKKGLTRVTLNILKNADENTVRKISKKGPPSDFMRVFLEHRLAQIEQQKGQPEEARNRLNALLSQNPAHPLASEIQVAQRGLAVAPAAASRVSAPANPNRVGCLVPLNGPYAKYGRLVLRGISMAAEDWNAEHPDQHITVVVRDAQAEPDLAVKSFEELVKEEEVAAVIGPLGVQSTKAVAPVANQWNVPLLTLTQRDEEIPDNPFVLHVFLDNKELVTSIVRYCREKLGYSRFAILYPEDRYGQKLFKVFAEVVQELGGNLLASVSYKEKSTDFKDPIQKLMNIAKKNVPPTGVESAPFEALFVPDQVSSVSLIAPQLPYNNMVGVTLLGTNLWGEASLVQAGGVYVEQAIFATPFYPESKKSQVQDFRTRYEAAYQSAPSYLEAQAYDAVMLFLRARFASHSSNPDRLAILRNLLQIRSYGGLAGTYSFSSQGRIERDYQLLQVQNGELVQVSP